ncbi:hypothetical protein HPB50_012559 [Hyalomma asiaticum]|uniref:Uncharacterized protein n=1 Tax=Hyalomma asiaticum TaxID=266040 RepID=A0ACB7TLM0_HYAAI|nr:hypothetical protein HPB50_012559 [Hyalomma asiaticum]
MSSSDWTDLERELLRRSEALHVVPYDDTPLEAAEPVQGPTSREDPAEEPPMMMTCQCGRFQLMPTAPERMCCWDMPQCTLRNATCICEDVHFCTLCLDTEVLRVAYCELQERGEEPQTDYHKVKEINEKTDPSMRRYCLGQVNPTDLLTREVSMDKLGSSSMSSSMSWLSESQDRWPVWPQQPISIDDRIICEMIAVHIAISCEPKERSLLDIESYSIIEQLLMVLAWIFRFIEHC